MPNTYINKVVYGGSPLIDLTSDTAVASDVAVGKYFHLATGERVEGTASGGGSGGNVWQDAQGYVHLDDEGGGSSVDVEPLSVTTNGTYTAPAGTAYSPVTVNVSGGGNDFVVTLSYNSQTDMWEPDKTFAQASTAYSGGKTIAFVSDPIWACAWFVANESPLVLGYVVHDEKSSMSGTYYDEQIYIWDSSGITLDESTPLYNTSSADAQPSDVAQGKTFFNADGYQYGTASGGGVSGVARGEVTIAADVTTTADTKITDTTEIGFTPTKFLFWANASPTANNAIYGSTYEEFGTKGFKAYAYYDGQSGTLYTSSAASRWTTRTAGCLYLSSSNVNIRTSTTAILKAGTYSWVAVQ